MSDFLPALDSSGIFRFKTPIADTVSSQLVLTCKSIRKISELLSSGIDVFQTYYASQNLNNSIYQTDKSNDVSIVGLYSDKANWIYVPSSQIDGYPDNSGVVYRRMGLAIDIGPIEDTYNLDTLHSLLNDLIYSQLGIKPDIRTISLSKASMVKSEDHEAIKSMRMGKINIQSTVYVDLAETKIALNKAIDKIHDLEQYILTTRT